MADEKFNRYYAPEGDGLSAYNRRFGDYAIPANEISLISNLVAQALCEEHDCRLSPDGQGDSLSALEAFIAKNPEVKSADIYQFLVHHALDGLQLGREKTIHLRIADFGCGDGRHLPLYIALAKELKSRGISIQLDGFDLSTVALDEFRKKAIEEYGFTPAADGVAHDNLALSFAAGSSEHLPKNADYDLSLCLFGVIAYPQKNERAKIIKDLYDATANAVLFSVPTAKIAADPQLGASAITNDRIDYQAAGQTFGYSLFPNMGDFVKEIVGATAKKQSNGYQMGHFQFALGGHQVTRPTHASQSLSTYMREMRDGQAPESLGNYIYESYVMRPNQQRAQDRKV